MKGPTGRECSQFTDVSVIALSGKQTSTLKFDNPSRRRVERIEVDGCLIVEGRRCDWLLRTDDPDHRHDIFVELKGCHLRDAMEQLLATARLLVRPEAGVKRRCYVALTRCPQFDSQVQRLKSQFQKQLNAHFETASNGKTVTL